MNESSLCIQHTTLTIKKTLINLKLLVFVVHIFVQLILTQSSSYRQSEDKQQQQTLKLTKNKLFISRLVCVFFPEQ